MTAAALPALRALAGGVLRMSLAGGAAALLCWAAGWGLRRLRAPRAVSAALWLAVLARLLCPVGLPVPVYAPAAYLPLRQAAGAEAFALVLSGELPAPQAAFSAQDALALVWLTVACLLAARALWHTARLRRAVRTAWQEEADGVVYYTGACVASPFVLGWLRPRIYLPAGLAGDERRLILLHERAHLRHGDHWLRPAYYLAACIHWFNPLAWLAFYCARQESEALCDEAVLCAMGGQCKADYCRSLLRFAAPCHGCESAAAFGEGSMKMRIQAILAYRRPALWATVCGAAAALAVGLLCLASPMPVEAAESLLVEPASSAAPDPAAPAEDGTLTLLWPVPAYTYVSRWSTDSHYAVDIAAPTGTDICAAAAGTVTYADFDTAYGLMVVIDHGSRVETRYAHCSSLYVAVGETVEQGQLIAAVGSTGRSTGPHCHFEVLQDGAHLVLQELFQRYAEDQPPIK